MLNLKGKIKKYVEDNYSDPNFDVNKLANKLEVSRNHLYNRTQFELGCTPHEYIENFRLEKARKLLLQWYNIAFVCKEIGYANKKTFHLAFKKKMNMSPGEFVINNHTT